MNAPQQLADSSIARILTQIPTAAVAFHDRRTACVGCPMARFCTLREAARLYEIPLGRFIEEIQGGAEYGSSEQGGSNE